MLLMPVCHEGLWPTEAPALVTSWAARRQRVNPCGMIFIRAPLRDVGKHLVRCSNTKTVNAYLAQGSNALPGRTAPLIDSTECLSGSAGTPLTGGR